MKTCINLVNISKSYSTKRLLDNVNLMLDEKAKIGVIGRNGAGKTTLIKILMGIEEADSGEVVLADDAKIGYLRQDDNFDLSQNVIEYLSEATGAEAWKCAKLAARFGIDHNKAELNVGAFSSGYRMRIKLTEMMLNEPTFLLLDEPSNFLDLNTLIDLENFLLDYNGGYLIISHDREFLMSTCESTLDVDGGKCTFFPGDIEEYFEYKEGQDEYVRRFNKNVDEKKAHLQKFVDKNRAKASKAASAQSKLKQLNRLSHIEIRHSSKNVQIRIPHVPSKKGFALISENLVIGYGDKVICTSDRIEIPRGTHVAVLGENGQGKTTLLKTLAGELSAIDGNFSYAQGMKLSYFAEHIYKNITAHDNVLSYLRRHASSTLLTKDLQALLGGFLFSGEDVNKKVTVLSGGEKSRLTLLASIIQCPDVLLLDEPTNHLDFETVENLGHALRSYNGTIFFTSHDRTFASLLADTIIEVKDGGISVYAGDYDSYVYHLRVESKEHEDENKAYEKSKMKDNTNAKSKSVASSNPNYSDNKKIKTQITKCKNKIKEYEKQIDAYKLEEKEIIEYFESGSPYSTDKSIRLDNIKKLISETEANLVLVYEEFDTING